MKRIEDEKVDEKLCKYVSLPNLQSFFLLAGAGAGKTRSLVTILQHIQTKCGQELNKENKEVAVITYTKAASEEIQRRINYDSLFHISTIHSFSWRLIHPFQLDIKEYIVNKFTKELASLEMDIQRNATPNRLLKKERLKEKLEEVKSVKKFNYSPDVTVSSGRATLTHNDVENILECFLNHNETFQKIIVQKFPVILIDECQDTKRNLMDAFIKLQDNYPICLGLFGDMMQRIYTSGKSDLITVVSTWRNQPKKLMNWRSQKRIIDLLNKTRKNFDGLIQYPNKEKGNGIVRLFILPNNISTNEGIKKEEKLKSQLLIAADDEGGRVVTLVLEHKMAARRNSFLNLYEALNENSTKRQLEDMSGKEFAFIIRIVIPFFQSIKNGDEFNILKLLRKEKMYSEHLPESKFELLINTIEEIKQNVNTPTKLTLRKCIRLVEKMDVFNIPENLIVVDNDNQRSNNWQKALDCDFQEFEQYFIYHKDKSEYITQQGSKGLEYDHVMVIMNDEEIGGNLFNYNKLFGVTMLSTTDENNISQGKDNTITRTQRLFYVTISRAKESLALVLYTSDTKAAKNYFIDKNIFNESEIKVYSDKER